MPDRDSVINDLNVAKLILCNTQMLTPEMCVKIGQAITSVLSLLKEQEAAYQGAVELLKQKTILFEDAIKRLKEQEERIETLESLRRIEHEGGES